MRLNDERSYAAAALLGNGEWLITGGQDQYFKNTAEFYKNGHFEPGSVPNYVSGHCLVSCMANGSILSS